MFFAQKSEQLAARTIFQGEEQFLLILERIIELDYEWMVHADQDVPFSHYVILLFALLNVFFFEDFHGIYSVVILAFLFY